MCTGIHVRSACAQGYRYHTHTIHNALETKYQMTNNGYGREQLSVLYNLNLLFFCIIRIYFYMENAPFCTLKGFRNNEKKKKLNRIKAHCREYGKSKGVKKGSLCYISFYSASDIYYVAYIECAVLSPIFLYLTIIS